LLAPQDPLLRTHRRADDRTDRVPELPFSGVWRRRCRVEKPPSSAEAAYRRADERGHPGGASKLGPLLKERGDLEGATAASRRAADSPDQQGTTLARDALSPTDD